MPRRGALEAAFFSSCKCLVGTGILSPFDLTRFSKAAAASCFAKDWQVRPNEVVFGTLVNLLGTSLKWMCLDKSSLLGICVCHRVAPTSSSS